MLSHSQPRCDVSGGSPHERVVVRRATERAMRALDFAGPVAVTIGTPDEAPDGTEAGGDDGGRIWIAKATVRRG